MKKFIFTVDDNIRFLKEICEGGYESIFEHPYLAMHKRFHEKFGLRVQLNLFFECDGFCLRDMTYKYKNEWESCSDWLKLSFHSRLENVKPYENSGYGEVFDDCSRVNLEILRFAGENSLAKTTTVHYCALTDDGTQAIKECGYTGLLGLYGTREEPTVSYQSTYSECERLILGEFVTRDGVTYGAIDIVLNLFKKEKILEKLSALLDRKVIKVMIHEQYFYEDYERYIPDFEEILDSSFDFLTKNGYNSDFFERLI